MTPTLVVGGGLAGLACAHALQARGREVLLFEAGARAGGVVDTLEADGFLFETGPNTVPGTSQAFLALADELGLSARFVPSDPAAGTRLLLFGGKLVPLPHSPGSFLTSSLLSLRAKLRLLSEPVRRFRPPADGAPEPTLGAFLEERLGVQAARRLGGAFVRGVYAAELDDLGASSAFPRPWELAREHGGLARGFLRAAKARKQSAEPAAPPRFPRGTLVSFPAGLGELPRALAAALGAKLRVHTEVRAIARTAAGFELELHGADTVRAETVVLATPAAITARLLGGLGLDRDLLADFGGTRYGAVTVVHLGFAPPAPALPRAFGFLVPPEESARAGAPRALGVLFPSHIFPGRTPAGGALATAIYRTADLGAEDPVETACGELASVLGLARMRPSTARVLQWPRAIPHYGPGHAARVGALRAELSERAPGLSLVGSSVDGVSVEKVLASGRAEAERLANRTP